MNYMPLSKSPFEKILKESDKDIRVSSSAAKALSKLAEEFSRTIASDAAELARHARRKTILDQDVILAKKKLYP